MVENVHVAALDFGRTAMILKVLAHPQRLRIVELLEHRSMSVSDISAALGIAYNLASTYLNLMKAYGLLHSRRQGRLTYYSLEKPELAVCVAGFVTISPRPLSVASLHHPRGSER